MSGKSITGLHIRNHLRNWGWGKAASALNNVIEERQITPEELDELKKLRAQPRSSSGSKTFGNSYNEGDFGVIMGDGTIRNETLRRIRELSKLRGAKTGGTRRKHNNRRKTRRN